MVPEVKDTFVHCIAEEDVENEDIDESSRRCFALPPSFEIGPPPGLELPATDLFEASTASVADTVSLSSFSTWHFEDTTTASESPNVIEQTSDLADSSTQEQLLAEVQMLRQEVSRLQAVLEPAEAADTPVILAPMAASGEVSAKWRPPPGLSAPTAPISGLEAWVCNSEKCPDWADAKESCSEAELAHENDFSVPQCRLNSKAKKYEPLQAKNVGSDFDYQFIEVVMPGLSSSLRSNRFVQSVDTKFSLNKVHLKVVLHHQAWHQTQSVVRLAKLAILQLAENNPTVWVLGFSARQPFKNVFDVNSGEVCGFEATCAGMQDENKACWDLFTTGHCCWGSACPYEHPVHVMTLRVSVTSGTNSSSSTASWNGCPWKQW
eukprot:gnl/TRDRNA2_/TRDRNA2_177867_c1_seq16.p1 gnl/TRDRNA2_/TRDRNA2_177867_c1~~gnl/TRDRNA2_/TRDRNA2_177867_c1_seq16.p1  ORF type:complete len:430 (+),score=70.28 gnl/TRDRNA2_/TRDRNA2_177867_c1_seq16:158-1291(+)